jgi:hypothetical protein
VSDAALSHHHHDGNSHGADDPDSASQKGEAADKIEFRIVTALHGFFSIEKMMRQLSLQTRPGTPKADRFAFCRTLVL